MALILSANFSDLFLTAFADKSISSIFLIVCLVLIAEQMQVFVLLTISERRTSFHYFVAYHIAALIILKLDFILSSNTCLLWIELCFESSTTFLWF